MHLQTWDNEDLYISELSPRTEERLLILFPTFDLHLLLQQASQESLSLRKNKYLRDRGSEAMASTSTTLSVSPSSTLIGQSPAASPQCVSLPALSPPLLPSPNRPQGRDTSKSTAYCRKISRNVVAMATGEAPAEAVATELPEIVKTVQEAWDKLEDKYAVTSLAFAGVVALWGSTGMISAIDRLPLVPGVLELVGIGYSGWFAYKNLLFKPDREVLLKKIKDTYKDIIGS
ncbi:hypothetical protein HHK36_000002 [Tetracentron sinense]|uniref:Cyanobacterial aminoacyl-tRNA synthetase CAAD domain-containing protein n=1 Tax=Tetracentron sinense TaxID=13715 RepID=A0A834ZQC2_TETSI|nr:hypothetical protein HHK36_000002 [Tetracentron sinense]